MKTYVTELVPDLAREEYLRKVIDASNISQVQLADAARIPTSTLGTMLARGIAGTAVDTIARICDALNLDLTDFVHGRFQDPTDVNNQLITLAANIRSTRRKLRYTRGAVARVLQIPLSDYLEIEACKRILPRKYVDTLAQLFEVTPNYLLGLESANEEIECAIEDPALDDDDIYGFGTKIRALREEKSISLPYLALAIGVQPKLLVDWENNDRLPTTYELAKIADYFKVSPSVFYEKADRHPLSPEHQELLALYEAAEERDKQLIKLILGIN